MPTKQSAERLRQIEQALPPLEELAARIRDGESPREIAREYGMEQMGLSNRLRHAGYRFDTGEPERVALRREMKEHLRSKLRTWSLPWMEEGLCAQTDPDAFFPEKGGSTKEAKAVCLGCDVRAQCLEYALSHGEHFGVWGAASERDRRKILRERAA